MEKLGLKAFKLLSYVEQFRYTILLALLFSLLGVPQPCAGKGTTPEGDINTLTLCMPSPILSLDPTTYRDRTTQVVLKNIFDSLTTRDSNMKVVPQLAESWKALDDTTWEFKLRRGVTFHNGDKFTARDVKFTLERVFMEGAMDGQTSPRKGLLGPLSSVNIVDAYTVQINTERSWTILPLMLSLQEIIPAMYVNDVGPRGFQKRPVGTGPFKFVEIKDKKRLILERFEGYYGGSPHKPPIQKARIKNIVFKIVPKKIERIAMLKRGETDIITQVPPEAVDLLEMSPGIMVLGSPPTRSHFVEMNSNQPPFNDRRVRLAFNYAVDMQAVVDHVFLGHAEVLPTILLPQAFAYNDSLKPYPYRPKLAKKILSDAGHTGGLSIRIGCIEADRLFANTIALFLGKVGVKSFINVVTKDALNILGRTSVRELIVGSWGNTTLDPIGVLVPKFRSSGRENFSNYSNREVDRLFSEAENTADSRFREQCFRQVQQIIHEDVPMIFGFAAKEFYGVNGRVKNFRPSASGMISLHDVHLEGGE